MHVNEISWISTTITKKIPHHPLKVHFSRFRLPWSETRINRLHDWLPARIFRGFTFRRCSCYAAPYIERKGFLSSVSSGWYTLQTTIYRPSWIARGDPQAMEMSNIFQQWMELSAKRRIWRGPSFALFSDVHPYVFKIGSGKRFLLSTRFRTKHEIYKSHTDYPEQR